jgi:aminoglycoside phosphotransferase family enzyme/predicted kinase
MQPTPTERSAASEQHRALVTWLGQSEAYPDRPATIEVVETHISVVFLAGERAYKLKKPVRYDFLDFSTAALREQACREELRLNRRLAADVYLDVQPITSNERGGLQIAGSGRVVDWLVVMRRLPADRMLPELHRRGELRPEHANALADLLIGFYRGLPPVPLTAEQYRSGCLAHVRGNRRELLAASQSLRPRVVERVHAWQIQLLLLRPELFDARIEQCRIVEGHGDLRPEHVCFVQRPVVFDCLDFSAELRQLDIADDLAFLAVECESLGAGWAGQRVQELVREGIGDRPPPLLVDFYKSYRACVRAKVAALRAEQLPESGQLAEEARRHLDLADASATAWHRPLSIVVGGLSGTGKTTLARALAQHLGAEEFHTDEIRKGLFEDSSAAAPNEGVYRPESRAAVYTAMSRRAEELLADRVSVVLDGTFSSAASLAEVREAARRQNAAFCAIRCVCRSEVARQRIADRLAQGDTASDAWAGLHDVQLEHWEAWGDDVPQLDVDTELPLERQVEAVICRLRSL